MRFAFNLQNGILFAGASSEILSFIHKPLGCGVLGVRRLLSVGIVGRP